MTGEPARGQIVVRNWPPPPPIANQVAPSRRISLHPLGRQRGAGRDAEPVAARRIDVVGMGFRIGKTGSCSGDPHNIRDEGCRPGVVAVLALRKYLTVFIMHSGPVRLAPAR